LRNSRLGDLNLNKAWECGGQQPGSSPWKLIRNKPFGIGHIETFTDLSINKGNFTHLGTSTIGNLTVKTADATHPALGFGMI